MIKRLVILWPIYALILWLVYAVLFSVSVPGVAAWGGLVLACIAVKAIAKNEE